MDMQNLNKLADSPPCPHCARLRNALEMLGAELQDDNSLRVKHRTMFIEFINQQMRRDLAEAQAEIERLKDER
jgi:hypothetical protein